MNKLFFSLLLVASMNGCVTDSSATGDNWLNNEDPEADALVSLEKRDFRFMAISLRGTVIPGTDRRKALQYELKCGVKFMSGVSDTVRSQEHLKLMQKAHDYAAKYNAIIKTRCIP